MVGQNCTRKWILQALAIEAFDESPPKYHAEPIGYRRSVYHGEAMLASGLPRDDEHYLCCSSPVMDFAGMDPPRLLRRVSLRHADALGAIREEIRGWPAAKYASRCIPNMQLRSASLVDRRRRVLFRYGATLMSQRNDD